MRLFGKCALLIAPLLAGCAAMQLSSQGAGTKPGGKANSNSMAFPEDRDWLAEAGMSQYKDYAKYLRPNVGIPEDKLGMSMKQFREIEKQIREAVLSEKPKTVLDRIKKEKFGVVATANGANAAPDSVTDSNYMTWSRARAPEVKADLNTEIANVRKLTGALNAAVFDHILKISDEVLVKNGVNIQSSPNLRGKAFVAAAFYFTADGVQYEPLSRSMGPGSGKTFGYRTIGAFILDRPRGVCREQTITLIGLINSKGSSLGLYSQYYLAETSTKDNANYWQGYNHGTVKVNYAATGSIECYDVTKKVKIDSRDSDAAAAWITNYTGVVYDLPYDKSQLSQLRTADGDPVSLLSRAEFQSLDRNVSSQIRSAVR